MSYVHKTLAAALSVALGAGSLVACGGSKPAEQPATTAQQPATTAATQAETQMGMPNPFVECSNVAEVGDLVGFVVTFPEGVSGYPNRSFSAIKDSLAQAMYTNDQSQRVIVRKGATTEDVSGDYGEYESVTTVDAANGAAVTLKGDGKLVYVATWEQDGHAFAIDADAGLEQDAVLSLVLQTM